MPGGGGGAAVERLKFASWPQEREGESREESKFGVNVVISAGKGRPEHKPTTSLWRPFILHNNCSQQMALGLGGKIIRRPKTSIA